jgi:hypothetical protein
MGLWVLAASWCARELTDGHIPMHMVDELCGTSAEAGDLVACGYWLAVDDGYQMVDWSETQPTRDDVIAKRRQNTEKVNAWRAKKRQPASNPVTPSGTNQVDNLSPVPDPTRPDPTPVSTDVDTGGGPRRRASRLPEDFAVTTEMRAWAAERAPLVDVDTATERFCNHWRAKAGKDATKLDWLRTWNNWLLRDQEDRMNRQKPSPTQRAAAIVQAGREVQGRQITTLALAAGS